MDINSNQRKPEICMIKHLLFLSKCMPIIKRFKWNHVALSIADQISFPTVYNHLQVIFSSQKYCFFIPCIICNLSSSIEILMMIYFIYSITAGIAGEFIAIVVVQTSYRFLHLQNQCECVTTAMKNLWRIHDGWWKIIECICCFSNWILYYKK